MTVKTTTFMAHRLLKHFIADTSHWLHSRIMWLEVVRLHNLPSHMTLWNLEKKCSCDPLDKLELWLHFCMRIATLCLAISHHQYSITVISTWISATYSWWKHKTTLCSHLRKHAYTREIHIQVTRGNCVYVESLLYSLLNFLFYSFDCSVTL